MLKKILLTSVIGIVITVVGAVATPTDLDRKTPSSRAYVDTSVATKQLKIPAAGQPNVGAGETVMTYTANGDGEIGERGLYSDPSSYNATADGDKLITASALNDTFTNLPTTDTTKLECANENDGCSLWTIVDQTAYGDFLPVGYTRLEYIESTGTQYIDTGYIMTNATGIKIELDDTAINSPSATIAAYFVGTQSTTSYQGYFTRYQSQSSNLVSVWAWNGENVLGTNIQSTHSTVYINYMNDRKYKYSNGTNTYSRSGDLPTLIETNVSLFLFAVHMRNDIASYFGKGKIYSVQITENNATVHNFVPAKNSSNVVGMYDLVSGTFFTNAATTGDDFVAGPEI